MHGIIVLNRNGGRRPIINGRRRKKISPFKTSSRKALVLWIIFFVFIVFSSILFIALLYLDLVLREKNSKELALCCGAFSVSLMTALRIWVSLPDQADEDRLSELPTRVGPLRPLPETGVGRSGARRTPPRHPHIHSNHNHLTDLDIQQEHARRPHNNALVSLVNPNVKRDTSYVSLPPAYSTLNLYTDLPNYEEAVKTINV